MKTQNINKYKTTSQTIGKSKQILMLYEGAIRFLKRAKEAAEKNDTQERFNNLDKFSQIVNGLSDSLDQQKGGEMAVTLRKFYLSIYLRSINLHKENNFPLYEQIIQEMQQMLSAWQEVDSRFAHNNTGSDEKNLKI